MKNETQEVGKMEGDVHEPTLPKKRGRKPGKNEVTYAKTEESMPEKMPG